MLDPIYLAIVAAIEAANLFYDTLAQSALTQERIIKMGHDPDKYVTLKSILEDENVGMSSPVTDSKPLAGGVEERYVKYRTINPQAFANLRQRIEHDSNAWSTFMGIKGQLNSLDDLAKLKVPKSQSDELKMFMATHKPGGAKQKNPLAKYQDGMV